MKKTKITKTTFGLSSGEVAIAVIDYIIKINHYSADIMNQSIEMQPVLNADTELEGIEMSFTNTKK